MRMQPPCVDGAGRAYIAETRTNFTSSTPPQIIPTRLSHHRGAAVIGGTNLAEAAPNMLSSRRSIPPAPTCSIPLSWATRISSASSAAEPDVWHGVAVDANGYFYLVGETMASTCRQPPAYSAHRCSFGQPSNLCANLARLRREVQSSHFRRWASLAYATYLAGKLEYRRLRQRHHHR